MLTFTPAGRFSWNYEIKQGETPVGTLELKTFRSTGSIVLDGRRLSITRKGFFSNYELRDEEHVVAVAERTGFIPPKYRIQAEDRELLLSPGFFRKAQLFQGDLLIADLKQKGLSRIVLVNPTQTVNISLPLLVFASTEAIILWRRRSRAK